MELFLYVGEYAKNVFNKDGGIVKMKTADAFNPVIQSAIAEAVKRVGREDAAVIVVPCSTIQKELHWEDLCDGATEIQSRSK